MNNDESNGEFLSRISKPLEQKQRRDMDTILNTHEHCGACGSLDDIDNPKNDPFNPYKDILKNYYPMYSYTDEKVGPSQQEVQEIHAKVAKILEKYKWSKEILGVQLNLLFNGGRNIELD